MEKTAELKEFLEIVNAKAGIANDPAHGKCLDGIVARQGNESFAVAHDDVLALANNAKASFLEGSNRLLVVDARQLCHCHTATSTSRTSAPWHWS